MGSGMWHDGSDGAQECFRPMATLERGLRGLARRVWQTLVLHTAWALLAWGMLGVSAC